MSLSSGSTGNYLWSNGSVDPEILVTEPGIYFLTLTDLCDNLSLSETIIVDALSNPEPPIISGSIDPAMPGFIYFESSSESTHWFESETAVEAISIGSSYELDSQVSNTVWVENVSVGDIQQADGGRTDMGEGQYHDNSIRWLLFDAYEDMVIHSVDVYANGDGTREIGVLDSDGNVIVSSSFAVVDGMNTLVLDFEVEEGTDYGLCSLDDDPQLWRDSPDTDLNYPYAIGDLASITRSTAGGNNAYNYYYFFYNWDVRVPVISCSSERIEATFLSDGCMYPLALNYLPNATIDNGSCLFPGCTDSDAGNYSPIANVDDGSCGEGCDPTDDAGCSTDANNDGVVNVTDLLLLLGEFGLECE